MKVASHSRNIYNQTYPMQEISVSILHILRPMSCPTSLPLLYSHFNSLRQQTAATSLVWRKKIEGKKESMVPTTVEVEEEAFFGLMLTSSENLVDNEDQRGHRSSNRSIAF